METEDLIPEPILFNCWKHHLGFIKNKIISAHINDKNDIKDFAGKLYIMGNSLSDFYTGMLSVVEITGFIIKKLNGFNVLKKEFYKDWIQSENKDYRIIGLQDRSTWALRFGKEKDRYIHVHPARYSVNSFRVRSTSLKTAALVVLWVNNFGGSYEDLNLINSIRITYLNESPVKSVSNYTGLGKIIRIFADS